MGRDEVNEIRQMWLDARYHRALDRADVGQDRAGRDQLRNVPRYDLDGAHGRTENDEIGVADAFARIRRDVVGYAYLPHALADILRCIDGDEARGQITLPRDPQQRG